MLMEKEIICPVCGDTQSELGGGFVGIWGERSCTTCDTLLNFDTEMISEGLIDPPPEFKPKPIWENEDYKKIVGKYHHLAAAWESEYYFLLLLSHGMKQIPKNRWITASMWKEISNGNATQETLLTLTATMLEYISLMEKRETAANQLIKLYKKQESLRQQWNNKTLTEDQHIEGK